MKYHTDEETLELETSWLTAKNKNKTTKNISLTEKFQFDRTKPKTKTTTNHISKIKTIKNIEI